MGSQLNSTLKLQCKNNRASTEQSIRGIRHGQYRPDLIICDDIEDLNSVKTKEGRDRTFNWFNGEVIPVGDKSTKIIIVGNLLHEDSLIVRLNKLQEEDKLNASFFAFPLLDSENNIAWLGKYPTMEDVKKLKRSIASESAYFREYLLKIISDEDRLVHPLWIKYYDEIPSEQNGKFRYTATGIDLAIKQTETADYTAMVSAKVFGYNDEFQAYVIPYPVNKKMGFPETVETAIGLSKNLGGGTFTKLFIEDVGYQSALIQHLVANNVPAEGVKVSGQDKHSRLALITHLIKQGKILFPKKGAKDLIMQLTGFGIEKYDDLADAFSILALKILESSTTKTVRWAFVGNLYPEVAYDDDDLYDEDW